MNVFIVYAHPSTKSFNHALLESFLKGLKKGGHVYQLSDLYREHFNPVLDFSEIKAEPRQDVKGYQEKIQWAEVLVFFYPTYWFRAPAILEGFFDRVFTSGFAFKYVNSMPVGLLKGKKAVVIETYGGPGWYYNFLMSRVPWKRFRAVLRFCGIRKTIHQPCYKVPFVTDEVRKKYLKKTQKIGENLK